MVQKERRVGDIDIYVTDDGRLFIDDLRNSERVELTDEYHDRIVDRQLMDEIEHRVRSGELLGPKHGRGKLVSFLQQ